MDFEDCKKDGYEDISYRKNRWNKWHVIKKNEIFHSFFAENIDK